LGRNGNLSPIMLRKSHAASNFVRRHARTFQVEKASDQTKPLTADDAEIGSLTSRNQLSNLESDAKKRNEATPEKWSRPLPPSPIPQNPKLKNEFLASLNCAFVHGKTRPRKRNLSSLQTKQSPLFSRENTIAQTYKAEHKSPPSFKQAEQNFQDERDGSLSHANGEQHPNLMKVSTSADQPMSNYAKFKQRREITKELNCPVDTAKDAQGLFDCYAKHGVLDYKNFRDIVVHILNSSGQELSDEDMNNKIDVSWREADRNYRGKLDFEKFAIWYSSWGFQQELLLSPSQIRTRDFARKYDLSIAEVDSVHSKFCFFDEDGSGVIEFNEFEQLLYKLMKVPKEAELPARRLQHFWKEIDLDGSGSVCFDEFLQWYVKYFDMKGGSNMCPVQQIYQSVRPNVGRFTGA